MAPPTVEVTNLVNPDQPIAAGQMRRVVLTGPRQLVFQDVPIPLPGPGQVLVNIRACALCTWEQRTYTGEEKFVPLLGGHEMSGIVSATGKDVLLDVKEGDQVSIAGLNRCGQCESCRRGYNNICDNARKMNKHPGDIYGPGGLGQYVIAHAEDVFVFRPAVPFEYAALTEPLACVLRSVKRAAIQQAEKVVIIGGGIMGLLHLQLVKDYHGIVIVSEPNAGRRAKALELGATFTLDPLSEDYVTRIKELTHGRGADVTYVCVAQAPVIEPAINATAKNGRVLLYSSIHPRGTKFEVDPNLFHNNEVTLTGTMSQTRQDFFESAELIGKGLIDLKPLISAMYPLGDVQQAFEAALQLDTYRVIVNP
ncbi:MAG TPA: zinc-binding dehydrogenase [Anaerolineae bacterium]|nr:zinc-binding dehydrogenase [Anaerolineae bacterium]